MELIDMQEGVARDRRLLLQRLEHQPKQRLVVVRQNTQRPRDLAQVLGLERRGGLVARSRHDLVAEGLAKARVLHAALGEGAQYAGDVDGSELLDPRAKEHGSGVEQIRLHHPHLRQDREQRRELYRSEAAVPRQGRAPDGGEELMLREADRHEGGEAAVELVGREGHEPRGHLHGRRVEERLRKLLEPRRASPVRLPRPRRQGARERGELGTRELLEPGQHHPAELRHEVAVLVALQPLGAVHLAHYVRHLLRIE
mmetsp:Transcript_104524/g.320134  ORF Transcript_104524/g.320134 Transcript_104524/m.320134 type:complete len:256 (+) Transcript_104524:493-1260(+)